MNDEIAHPVIKIVSAASVSAASVVGFTLADAASVTTIIASTLGAIYTIWLLSELLWKRVFKPLFIRRGWFGYGRGK